MVVITSDQRDVILDAVEAMYTAVATRPGERFHFPTGRRACEYVGYPAEQLDRLPATAVESFAGVGYPFAAGAIDEGDTVLDMTAAMREKCLANAERAGLSNVEVLDGNAEHIPLPDNCVDVVTTNGVINLVPEKEDAIGEIHRVLVPGGRLQISDIVVRELPSEACRSEPELWAECIVGATTESSYREIFREAGFVDVERLAELDYFAASPDESTREVAGGFGAHSVTLRATKP